MAAPLPPLPPLVITGASGFVGRRLVQLAAERGEGRAVTLLVRDAASGALPRPLPPSWNAVRADLAGGPIDPASLPQGAVIVHLAAATGRLSPAVMRAVNVEGTRHLLDAARASGARHVIFVSSIAAGFPDRRWYPYAEAKREGEQLVREGGIPFTIVRPTMVFGHGSPVQEGLERLALGAAPIVLGSGHVQVQPVHVDDLAAVLLALALAPEALAEPVEVGGATRTSLRDALALMRGARGKSARRLFGVPLAPIRRALAVAESLVGNRLPVTAGQMASFVNDSIAAPNPLVERLLPTPRSLTTMLADRPSMEGDFAAATRVASTLPASMGESSGRSARERADEPTAHLAREFRRFARHLGTADPPQAGIDAYTRLAAMATRPSDRLDAWLLATARASAAGCALADAYARLARPYGALRQRLVLALAVLESSAGTHTAYDTAVASGAVGAWLAMVGAGVAWVARTVAAVLLVGPLHLAASLLGRQASPRG